MLKMDKEKYIKFFVMNFNTLAEHTERGQKSVNGKIENR